MWEAAWRITNIFYTTDESQSVHCYLHMQETSRFLSVWKIHTVTWVISIF